MSFRYLARRLAFALQAIRSLLAANADSGEVSIDASAGDQNVTGSDENVLQYHQPDDRPRGEAILSDGNVRTPEEIFAGEEMVAQLDIVLREVNLQDRVAFVLYTLEGFTIEEISRLSDRPPDQVRKSIEHARERVLGGDAFAIAGRPAPVEHPDEQNAPPCGAPEAGLERPFKRQFNLPEFYLF